MGRLGLARLSSKAAFLTAMLFTFCLLMASTAAVVRCEKPIVVATTTVLSSIVEDLAGDRVVVEYISSPSVCPAHYDVKPSDVDKLKAASLVLAHGIEPWLNKLMEASGSKAIVVRIGGSWNTPSDVKRYYNQVAQALREHLSLNVDDALNKCLAAIDDADQKLKRLAKDVGFQGVPVVVMKWQQSFVEYLGFDVVASYGPPETVSPKDYQDILSNATKRRPLLVIDNLPSGTQLGLKIASEVGAVEVALQNFPKAVPEARNLTTMMLYNADLLERALTAAKSRITVENLVSENLSLKKSLEEVTMYLWTSIIANAVLAVVLGVTLTRRRVIK